MYRAEIWGWEEAGAIKKIQKKYIKLVVRLDRKTSANTTLQEIRTDRIRIRRYYSGESIRVEIKITSRDVQNQERKAAIRE